MSVTGFIFIKFWFQREVPDLASKTIWKLKCERSMFMPIRKKVVPKYTKPSEIKKSHAFSENFVYFEPK